MLFESARLKSSAKLATTFGVMIKWLFGSKVSVSVTCVGFGAASGLDVAPLMMLAAPMGTPAVPLSTTIVALL